MPDESAVTRYQEILAATAYAESVGEFGIKLGLLDGRRGFMLTYPDGRTVFHVRLGVILRSMLTGMNISEDHEVMVFGDPEGEENAW